MHCDSWYVSLPKCMNLIIHQSDEWTNDNHRTGSPQCWQLITDGLSTTGWQQNLHVSPRLERFDGL